MLIYSSIYIVEIGTAKLFAWFITVIVQSFNLDI